MLFITRKKQQLIEIEHEGSVLLIIVNEITPSRVVLGFKDMAGDKMTVRRVEPDPIQEANPVRPWSK